MAFNLIRRLMPHEEDFTRRFCELARIIGEAAEELLRIVSGGVKPGDVAHIGALETEADGVARSIFLAANRTFHAPIDREDILLLAHDLDEIVDLMEDAVKAIERYGLTAFPPPMAAIVECVVKSARVMQHMIPLLEDITRKHVAIMAACEEIGRLEGEADGHFDAGLSALRGDVKQGRIDVLAYVDLKELYELLEEVADGCDDVASVVRTITAKHV